MKSERIEISKPVVFEGLAETNEKYRAVVTYGNCHLKFDGTIVIEKMTESWKYGEEIQIKLITFDLPVVGCERQGNKNFSKVEICLPVDVAIKLLEDALKKIKGGVL